MKVLLRSVVLLVVSCPNVALATPADCIKVEPDLDRLACYDKELQRTPKSVPVETPPAGSWNVEKEVSKLTDQPTVILSLRSDESVNCGWNRGSKIRIVLRCMEKKTVAYFDTGCHMTSSEYNTYGEISYRLDADKARTVKGSASTDSRALGLWDGVRSVPFIKGMIGKSKMTVRMTPFSESSFTASFDIRGLDQSIKPLREACSW